MTAINVARLAKAPIWVNRFARNGKVPDAALQAAICELANQAGAFRPKEVFRWHGGIGSIPASQVGGGQRDRWRFAFHTGPLTTQLWCKFELAQQSNGVGSGASDAYGRLQIQDTALNVTGNAIFHYGSTSIANVDVPANFGTGSDYINVQPDTDYYGTFSDFNSARMISATVFEVPTDPNTLAGYLEQNFATTGPIYEAHRANAMTLARKLWQRSGAHVLNWCVDVAGAPLTTSSVTPTNVVDAASTTISAATPGYTLDMTGKDRLSQSTGIPCMLFANGFRTGGAGTDPNIVLANSLGAGAVTLPNFPATTAGWVSIAFNLPLGADKYDLQFYSKNATPFSLLAASIFEYEP